MRMNYKFFSSARFSMTSPRVKITTTTIVTPKSRFFNFLSNKVSSHFRRKKRRKRVTKEYHKYDQAIKKKKEKER